MKRPNLASRNHRRRFSFAASVSAARGGAVCAARKGREAAPERTRRENVRIGFRILFIWLSLHRERLLFTARHVRLAGSHRRDAPRRAQRKSFRRQSHLVPTKFTNWSSFAGSSGLEFSL